MSMSFSKALRMGNASCVAFVGAGGKTTAMFKLAGDIQTAVIVTATTHLGAWQTKLADKHIATESAHLDQLEINPDEVTLITGTSDGDRVKPISPTLLDEIYHQCKKRSIPLLIEADGSRQKPLKGWGDHEPPIPEFVDMVVQIAGLSGLGKPLTEEHVHRPEIFSHISELEIGKIINTDSITRALKHPEGGLKNIPEDAERVVILNQADTPQLQSAAHEMASRLLPAYRSVVIASLVNGNVHAVHEPVGGIILAAGEATRFGEPKQLLDWKGRPFVRAVAQTAIQAGVSPVIVVTGSNAELVESAIKDLEVAIVRNENWRNGQGSSIMEGVNALISAPLNKRGKPGGVIFLLADQPQVTISILQALMEKHAVGLHPIIAPLIMDRRGNPVLFDCTTFADLMTIEGDTGGRAIFHKHPVEYVPWHDDRLLLDVDTPEQYQRLISSEDL